VVHGHLREPEAASFDEGRNKTVHAPEENEAVAAGGAQHFEGAAGVAHPVAGEPAPDKIGDAALQAFESGILAFGPVTADEVVAFMEPDEHGRDIAGVILEVAVQQGDDGGGGSHDAGVHGRRLAAVFREFQHPDERVAGDVGHGGIGGAVVYEKEFEILPGQGGHDFPNKGGNIAFLIEERDNNRK
jgi:hypothetical protein